MSESRRPIVTAFRSLISLLPLTLLTTLHLFVALCFATCTAAFHSSVHYITCHNNILGRLLKLYLINVIILVSTSPCALNPYHPDHSRSHHILLFHPDLSIFHVSSDRQQSQRLSYGSLMHCKIYCETNLRGQVLLVLLCIHNLLIIRY